MASKKILRKKVVNFKIDSLQVVFIRETLHRYVAYSPALNLATQGKTMAEATKNFEAIVKIFLEEVIGDGILENTLKELGWERGNNNWKQPKRILF